MIIATTSSASSALQIVLRLRRFHIWLSRHFWPNAPLGAADRYASPAPDWLDEAVAQLMEGAASTPFERAKFVGAAAGPDAIAKAMLKNLLLCSHPAQKVSRMLKGSKPASIIEDELKAMGIESPETFYTRSAGLGSFLISKSGNDRILAEIALAYAGGKVFESWLGRHGGRYRIGSNVGKMEASLLAWLQEQASLRGHVIRRFRKVPS